MMGSKETAQIERRPLVPVVALLGIFIFIGLGSAASAFAQHTYYVSKTAGSDSNQGTAKATPWAHLPGMASCTSNCSSYNPSPGDTFILKGCDVWTNSDLPVLWNWSGSSGGVITIGGEDQTWYNTTNCPSAWNRPVFDAQKQALNPDVLFRAASNGNTSYVTLDSIEMRGLYCSGSCSGAQNYVACYNNCTNWTFSNLYMHGWNIVTDGDCKLFQGAPDMAGTTVTQSIIDGSDATGASPTGGTCYAMYPSLPPTISNNVIHDVANGIVGSPATSTAISGNLIYNIIESNAGSHPNVLESLGSGTWYVFNNVFHDFVGEAFFFGGNSGSSGGTQYVWNNIWYNSSGNPPEGDGGLGGFSFYAWNNTVVPNKGQTCFLYSKDAAFATVVIENNHCISTGSVSSASWGGTTPTLNNNVLMSPTTATTQGYTSSQTYAYSPTAGTNGTVGAGKTICGVEQNCTGNLAALMNDTAFSCTQQTVSGVVQAVCPARTVLPRPGDAGAYQYVAGDTQPNPPTNLTATVQ
jgi:hypothetical protein